MTLLYRGSDNGWMLKDFHSRCDNKGPTVSLFKHKYNGHCIGGYTQQHWDCSDEYKADPSAMLFNLTKPAHFPSRNSGKDIECCSNYGPSFSGGG